MVKVGERTARILHVDDDEEVRVQVREFLEEEEIPEWGRPTVVGIGRFDEALDRLERERFDLVILDLRLGAHAQDEIAVGEEAGQRTLEEIRQRRFVPVVFWTALPQNIRDQEGPMVRVREKTKLLPALHEAVVESFATSLPSVNRALLELFEEEQRSYMWGFVSDNWEHLGAMTDETALAYLLARRLGRSVSGPGIQRLAMSLGATTQVFPPNGKIHAVEIYIQPPLGGSVLQAGDLLRGAANGRDGWWLVLTPSCDLEHGKAENVLLAAGDSIKGRPELAAWHAAASIREAKGPAGKIEALVSGKTGGQDDRWLYLPAAIAVPDLVIDMQQLHSVVRAEVDTLERVASLDPPFAEAAINRFGRYFGRIGTPDLDTAAILKRLGP